MLKRAIMMSVLCISMALCSIPVLAADVPLETGYAVIIGQINNPDKIHHDTREVYFISYYFGDFWVSLPAEAGLLDDLVGGSFRLTLAEPRSIPFDNWGSEHVVGVSLEPLKCISGEFVETGEDYLLVSVHESSWEDAGAKELMFVFTEDTKSNQVYNPGEGGMVIYEELEDGTLHALCVAKANG